MKIKDVAVACFVVQVYLLQGAQYAKLTPTAKDKLLFTRFQSAVGSVINL
jgi:hypothetical protein